MLNVANRKSKINLADYSYKKDITNRLFLSELKSFEIKVLQELLFQPSRCKLSDIADALECDKSDLSSSLNTFSRIGLTMLQEDTLFIDKELRKYFEFHTVKFHGASEPSFESLQGLFNKVPISVLPTWYSIPRSSDNIFSSIVEKYLHTPKIYENYLKELIFDDPILHRMIEDVRSSPDLRVEAASIRKTYNLTREKLQEYLLLLEFHFVLTSSFQQGTEVISFFSEWADFIRFQRKNSLIPLPKDDVQVVKSAVCVSSREQQEEAMTLFKTMLEGYHNRWNDQIGTIEKSVFEIEKALRHVPSNSWFTFDNFASGLISPIGHQPPVTLQRIGKKWRYSLPSYNPHEKAFIEVVLFDLLHKVGITATGDYLGKPCFMITPFGRVALGEV